MLCIMISENTGSDHSHIQVLQRAAQPAADSGFKQLVTLLGQMIHSGLLDKYEQLFPPFPSPDHPD